MAKKSSGLISTGTVAQNRKARHDYAIGETFEAGIQLVGSEVKSLRLGRANVQEAYAGRKGALDEVWVYNMYIPEYGPAAKAWSHEPRRPRKLLLKKREIVRLLSAVARDGMTIVPLELYFNDRGIAKLRIGLATGKKKADKRESIKQRDWDRQKARILRDKG